MGTLRIFMGTGRKGVILGGLREKKNGCAYVYGDFGFQMKIFPKFHDIVKGFYEWDSWA